MAPTTFVIQSNSTVVVITITPTHLVKLVAYDRNNALYNVFPSSTAFATPIIHVIKGVCSMNDLIDQFTSLLPTVARAPYPTPEINLVGNLQRYTLYGDYVDRIKSGQHSTDIVSHKCTCVVTNTVGATVGATVGSPADATVRSPVDATVGSPVDATVGSPTAGATVGSPVDATVGSHPVGATAGSPADATVGATVRSPVDATVGATVGSPADATVRSPVDATVGATVRSPVGAAVGATVGSPVDATVGSPADATITDTAESPADADLIFPCVCMVGWLQSTLHATNLQRRVDELQMHIQQQQTHAASPNSFELTLITMVVAMIFSPK